LLALQQTVGNRAVQRLVRTGFEEIDGDQHLASTVDAGLGSPGQALDRKTREFFESRFGYDFSQVSVHTGSRAAESAEALQAKAYTVGPQIVFGSGEYAPESPEGKELLAHELAHVVQQAEGSTAAPGGPGEITVSDPSDTLETQAEQTATEVIGSGPAADAPVGKPVSSSGSGATVMRDISSAEALRQHELGTDVCWVPGKEPASLRPDPFAYLRNPTAIQPPVYNPNPPPSMSEETRSKEELEKDRREYEQREEDWHRFFHLRDETDPFEEATRYRPDVEMEAD
jgi:hypothetical protein